MLLFSFRVGNMLLYEKKGDDNMSNLALIVVLSLTYLGLCKIEKDYEQGGSN